MTNHYGRTELAKILALLALLALCTSGAEAGTTVNAVDLGGDIIYVPNYYNGLSIALYEGSATEYVTTDEVAALLERCLEYVRDGDKNYLENAMDGIRTTLLDDVYVLPHRTLKDDAQSAVNEAKAEKDALDRETKLRRDIEALLGKLKGEKP